MRPMLGAHGQHVRSPRTSSRRPGAWGRLLVLEQLLDPLLDGAMEARGRARAVRPEAGLPLSSKLSEGSKRALQLLRERDPARTAPAPVRSGAERGRLREAEAARRVAWPGMRRATCVSSCTAPASPPAPPAQATAARPAASGERQVALRACGAGALPRPVRGAAGWRRIAAGEERVAAIAAHRGACAGSKLRAELPPAQIVQRLVVDDPEHRGAELSLRCGPVTQRPGEKLPVHDTAVAVETLVTFRQVALRG